MDDSLKISFEKKPKRDDLEFIGRMIDKFNCSRVGYDDFESLNYFLRDENNLPVGGLLAATFWQWLYVKILWVDEKYRFQGYGQKLLLEGEGEAVRRGCKFAFLDTWEFQAPKFYLNLGYEIFGELNDFPQGHTRYFLKKNLP
jgi:GNAT superfamily N-acetyltransferase